MAAKRSPILGYNHNVRYRGIVFHIQTEDSGIINPHVFTHLFHGGVIISTRKLVYDPDANDDAVKSLMQAQHKAVMKDLRRATFDDKIDSYLGGTPGLLPREAPAIEATDPPIVAPIAPGSAPVSAAPIAPPVSAPPPAAPVPPPMAVAPIDLTPIDLTPIELAPLDAAPFEAAPFEAAPFEAAPFEAAPFDSAPIELTPLEAAPLELTPFEAAPAPAEYAAVDDSVPTLTAPITDATIPMSVLPEPDEYITLPQVRPVRTPGASTPPPVRVAFTDLEPGRAPTERVPPTPLPLPPALAPHEPAASRQEVSAAMRAIQVSDDELSAAGLTETAEIHSPAPPSAPTPPGLDAGSSTYQFGRKPPSVDTPASGRPPIPRPGAVKPPPVPPIPARAKTPAGSSIPTPSRAVPSMPPPVRPAPPRPPMARQPTPPANALPRVTPPTGAAPPAMRGRPASGGGVVVSRPAVIVGAKGAPTAVPPKVRRARESFGGDLISERSLDEVILAYLSEDTNDE